MTTFSPQAQKTCRICGKQLNQLQSFQGDVCERLECRGPQLQASRDKHDKQRRDERREAGIAALQSAEIELDSVDQMVFSPFFERPQSQLPMARATLFKDFLEKLIGDAAVDWEPDRSQLANERKLPSDGESSGSYSPFLMNACMTCGGNCCQLGGTQAYLDKDSVHIAWNNHPELDANQLLQLYVDSLPESSLTGSCVFHTNHGCNLDRSLRSSTCNHFFCEEIMDCRSDLVQLTAKSVTVVAIDNAGKARRVATIDRAGQRKVDFDGDDDTSRS